ncbi:MAG: hypothetical protein ACPL3E_02270, partial [Minisyncoccia bacterium]
MTLLIKNGKILNFDQNNKLDVLISADKISAIGNFYNKKADEIIDAEGAYISYGFTDIYNETDHNLKIFSKDLNQITKEGITNVLIGHSGVSLVPLLTLPFAPLKYYSSYYGANSNWQNLSDFFNFLNKNKLSFNLGTFIGFKTLKHIIVGENLRLMTKKEFYVFLDMLKNLLKDGAGGFSLDWESVCLDEISLKQIEEISKVLSKNSKILSVTLPASENIEKIIDDLLKIVLETNVRLLLNNYLSHYLTPEKNIHLLKK